MRPALHIAAVACCTALGLSAMAEVAAAQQPAPPPSAPRAAAQAGPAAKPSAPQTKDRPSALSNFGSNNKEPIKIDSDRLDVFDKEGRAVFAGNVVAVQGDSTIRCSIMTVFYEQAKGAGQTGSRQPGPSAGGDSSIKKIDCKGPVTVVSKTQTATGDTAEFDRVANKVYLNGNVALSDGPNVTRGEHIVYDLDSGVANVETVPGGRVRALFVPGSNNEPQKTEPQKSQPQRPR